MMKNTDKKTPPPYSTYKTFSNFIIGLRENGAPSHITRSMLPGSNSAKASILATLKYLHLIINGDEPSEDLNQLVDPSTNYNTKLKEIIIKSYVFLNDPEFNIKTTTTEKVVDKFKAAGASGSTITKGMAFLLAACKDAKIEVSKYVKAPAPTRAAAPRRRRSMPESNTSQKSSESVTPKSSEGYNTHDGMEHITVSLRNMDDGHIYFPAKLEQEDAIKAVKAAIFMMKNYYDLQDENLTI